MSGPGDRRIRRLVHRSTKGDARAFGRLYDEHVDRIYAFTRSRIANNHDAEDVTETVFLKAWGAIGCYDERGLPFSAWLFRIARNAVVDWHRRQGRVPTPVEDCSPDTMDIGLDVEAVVISTADGEGVREALKTLTDDQAAVIVLRFYWDMSHAEVAASLGKTEGAVKALQHRAVQRLGVVLTEADRDD